MGLGGLDHRFGVAFRGPARTYNRRGRGAGRWVIASVIVIVIALVYAELGGMFPVSGGGGLFPQYAFGNLAGASFGWFAYIQAAAYAPIEVLAALEYMSTAEWAKGVYNPSNGTLPGKGFAVAIGLMVVFTIINLVGIRWVDRANTGLRS